MTLNGKKYLIGALYFYLFFFFFDTFVKFKLLYPFILSFKNHNLDHRWRIKELFRVLKQIVFGILKTLESF